MLARAEDKPLNQSLLCPCCGSLMMMRLTVQQIIDFVPLTPAQRRIMRFLARRVGYEVPTEAVLDHLYADDPRGGPNGAPAVLRQQLHYLRKRLKPYGLSVKGLQSGPVLGGSRVLLYWLNAGRT